MKAEDRLRSLGPKLPEAPKHLSPSSRRWWQEVARDYELESSDYKILTLAAEALDRTEQARVQIAKEGLTVPGRAGPRTHPAVAIERDSRLAYARLLRELDLRASAGPEGRPPALRRYV